MSQILLNGMFKKKGGGGGLRAQAAIRYKEKNIRASQN